MKFFLCFLLLSVFPCALSAQAGNQQPGPQFMEGEILEKSTHEPVPYAKVYNQTNKKAVLTDEKGYFRIEIASPADSIRINVLGYKLHWIDLKKKITFYEILLEENAKVLGEVKVTPEDNSHLYRLLQDCRKNQSAGRQKSKMYYELKSFVDSQQVELVESFYNGSIAGYDLEALDIKNGRFALQDFNHTFFGSMESSKAITMISLFKGNEYFPHSPFEFNLKRQKELYYLRLLSRSLNSEQDSVYVIEFIPRDKTGHFFGGRAFVDPRGKNVIQVELHCNDAQIHPFLPVFPSDTIENLDLHITKSFEKINGKMCFRHIDFSYETTYKNRNDAQYRTSTKAILYAYDFDSIFILPTFKFQQISDYRKINAIPYNAYFWKNHDELKLSDQKNQNELFFSNPNSTTSKTIFSNGKFDKGLLENPYITWSGRRIRFREFLMDTIQDPVKNATIISGMYNLNVKIFMDVNHFQDTVQIVTAAIFDPYESYYKLPLDQAALCFINVYFDLAELERRNLENAIFQSDRALSTVEKLYSESQKRVEAMQAKYIKEADHGQNERAMEKWNKMVLEGLKINNLEIFRPYGAERE